MQPVYVIKYHNKPAQGSTDTKLAPIPIKPCMIALMMIKRWIRAFAARSPRAEHWYIIRLVVYHRGLQPQAPADSQKI